MEQKRKIAVIGDPNSVMIFKAIGLDVFTKSQGRIHRKTYS
jgi:vacuolar-type H+-ATPase subunit F/Vma7